MKKIGILGLVFNSTNLGCSALAYSFSKLISSIEKENNETIEVVFIERAYAIGSLYNFFNYGLLEKKYLSKLKPKYDCEDIVFRVSFYYRCCDNYFFTDGVKKCDIVIDYSSGDSFTDIYGQDRFEEQFRIKKALIDLNIPLILGPQTIGPFNEKNAYTVSKVLGMFMKIYARDEMSVDYVKKISDADVILTTDTAFFLPYDKSEKIISNKIKIGLNISGLLWNGGYTGRNDFGLVADYRIYIYELLKRLVSEKCYEIHIIPHVLDDENNKIDNDYLVSKKIIEEFEGLILAPEFHSPMDAKSYIWNMDAFSGARMHSDIAAYSAMVPVIPFSYSRKFEGLFNSLNYPYIVDGKQLDTMAAVEKTVEFVKSIDKLKKNIVDNRKDLEEKMFYFKNEIQNDLYKCSEKRK